MLESVEQTGLTLRMPLLLLLEPLKALFPGLDVPHELHDVHEHLINFVLAVLVNDTFLLLEKVHAMLVSLDSLLVVYVDVLDLELPIGRNCLHVLHLYQGLRDRL